MQVTTSVGVLIACGLATHLHSQARVPSDAQLVIRKEQKLAEAWLKNANWTLSFADAKARAQREGKLIFGYFTRSYAP